MVRDTIKQIQNEVNTIIRLVDENETILVERVILKDKLFDHAQIARNLLQAAMCFIIDDAQKSDK